MRLGTVKFEISYVVDLDNQEMVDHAQDAIIEDIQSASRYGATYCIEETHDASEGDIPEFLANEVEDL